MAVDIQPMYIPYYSLNPYSVPIPIQPGVDDSAIHRVEQTYHIPILPDTRIETDGQ